MLRYSISFLLFPTIASGLEPKWGGVARTENTPSLLQMKQNNNLNMTYKGNSCHFIRPWVYHAAIQPLTSSVESTHFHHLFCYNGNPKQHHPSPGFFFIEV